MTVGRQRAAIAALGNVLSPDVLAAVYALFRAEQEEGGGAPDEADIAYGDHDRQRFDLYLPGAGGAGAPIVLFVHGGGFLRGEKRSDDHPFNAHVGRWAARHGAVGAVMNYRLAPQATWPAGGEDVVLAIEALRARFGEAARIVPIGTSAGSVHVATALRLRPDLPVAGAVLLSGLYGFTPLDECNTLYYGPADRYAERIPREAVTGTALPLLVACAEFDPPRFQAETLGLLAARLERHGAMPRAYVASGHNHFSLAYHLGGADTRVADEILSFVAEVTA